MYRRHHPERGPSNCENGGGYGSDAHRRQLPNSIDYPNERYANSHSLAIDARIEC